MKFLRICCVLFSFSLSSFSNAGPYTDQLSACLVGMSSEEEKLVLVKWMYTAMSLHPAVAELATVEAAKRDAANEEMADLLVDLLTQKCIAQTEAAIANEGPSSLQASFGVLGQVAATELFSNPNVTTALADLNSFLDIERINQSLGLGQ